MTKEELDKIMSKMKRDKAPSPDDFTTDWLKDLNEQTKGNLLDMFNEWWEKE